MISKNQLIDVALAATMGGLLAWGLANQMCESVQTTKDIDFSYTDGCDNTMSIHVSWETYHIVVKYNDTVIDVEPCRHRLHCVSAQRQLVKAFHGKECVTEDEFLAAIRAELGIFKKEKEA